MESTLSEHVLLLAVVDTETNGRVNDSEVFGQPNISNILENNN